LLSLSVSFFSSPLSWLVFCPTFEKSRVEEVQGDTNKEDRTMKGEEQRERERGGAKGSRTKKREGRSKETSIGGKHQANKAKSKLQLNAEPEPHYFSFCGKVGWGDQHTPTQTLVNDLK
jgi:hypothetical protein